MYERKKFNVMRTNVTNPGNKWCEEAYEHADAIIWINGRIYYRVNTYKVNKIAYFISAQLQDNYVTFYRLHVYYSGIIIFTDKKINYS